MCDGSDGQHASTLSFDDMCIGPVVAPPGVQN